MRFTLIMVLLLIVGGIWLSVGTLDPCEMLRKKLRADANREGGLASIVTIMPDSVVDAFIETQWGRMTPLSCAGWMLKPPSAGPGTNTPTATPAAVPHSTPAAQPQISRPASPQIPTRESLQQAAQKATTAMVACRDQRLRGELPTFVSSADCSGPQVLAAYQQIHYPFMDLIADLVGKRRELASQLDQHLITDQQAQVEETQFVRTLDAGAQERLNSAAR